MVAEVCYFFFADSLFCYLLLVMCFPGFSVCCSYLTIHMFCCTLVFKLLLICVFEHMELAYVQILQVEKKRKRKAQEKDGKAKKQKDFKF